jgi:hypothetical protein
MKTTTDNRECHSKCATAVGLTVLSVFLCLVGCHKPRKTSQTNSGSRYLYIWMGDKDEKDDDFIAVVDVREGSPTYGKFVASQPVD